MGIQVSSNSHCYACYSCLSANNTEQDLAAAKSSEPTTPLPVLFRHVRVETMESPSAISKLQTQILEQDVIHCYSEPLTPLEPGLHLTLHFTNSSTVGDGYKVNLTPEGCEETSRRQSDEITYFGFEPGIPPAENDIVIPCDPEMKKKPAGRHFQVKYSEDKHAYLIKDLGTGSGAFLRLTNRHSLSSQTLLSIGDSYLFLTLLTTYNSPTRQLRVKTFSRSRTSEVLFFTANQVPGTGLRIGRHPVCPIHIADELLSKVQLTLLVDNTGKWTVVDGDWETKRESTNGTWLYLSQEREIEDGMVLKVCGTLVKATLWRRQ